MKVVAKGLFVLFLMCFFANAGSSQPKLSSKSQVINLSDKDSGKILNILKGQVFTLTLSDHVDGGYRFDKAGYDTTVLHLDHYTEKSPAKNSAMGRPGLAVWQFTALSKNKTSLKISASRPWKGGGAITIFESIVMVK